MDGLWSRRTSLVLFVDTYEFIVLHVLCRSETIFISHVSFMYCSSWTKTDDPVYKFFGDVVSTSHSSLYRCGPPLPLSLCVYMRTRVYVCTGGYFRRTNEARVFVDRLSGELNGPSLEVVDVRKLIDVKEERKIPCLYKCQSLYDSSRLLV